MKITRRTAIIAGTVAAVAVAGALIAGPASASGKTRAAAGNTNTSQSFGMMGGRGGGMMGGFDADGDGRPDTATRGGPMMRGRGDFGPMMGRGGMLHSEGVVAQLDATGKTTYVTVLMQRGTITGSPNDGSISIKSADGFTATWTISNTTRLYRNGAVVTGSQFVAGDVVMAEGPGSGTTGIADIVNNFAARRQFLPPTGGTTSSSTTA